MDAFFRLKWAGWVGLCCAVLSCAAPGAVAATQVDAKALSSEGLADQWLSYGRNYSEQRFSPLADIDQRNVSRLGLQWYVDLPDARSLQATPLAVDGILYFTTGWAVVHAVDARTGKLIWRFDPQSRRVLAENPERLIINWGTHRGVAFWNTKVYVATSDGRLMALSARTGKPVWSVQTFDPKTPRYITGAPRAFGGKILIGHGGGDVGSVRGYVTAYDAETGKQVWRFHTVPGNPALGFENKAMEMAAASWSGEWWKLGGGGAVWNAMTYDPEFNRVYIGTGNAVPWNQQLRGAGDNLFAASIVALDADTGEYRWHYQTTPGDTWDYDAASDMILTTVPVDGKPRSLLLQAGKNGFFYVIDRATGKLVSADAIGKPTWAQKVDTATGRPVELADARYKEAPALVWPGSGGAHGWQPMSYSPLTGLAYIPILDAPGFYDSRGLDSRTWRPTEFGANFGLNLADADAPLGGGSAALIAWDPLARREVWRVTQPGAWPAGTLVTQGGLVFSGNAEGRFSAFAAESGKRLWDFDAKRGIVAPPISYRVGGRQYISVLVDWSGGAVQSGGSLFAQHGWTYRGQGRRLLTFALDGKSALPRTENPPVIPVDLPGFNIDPVLAERGNRLYAENCGICHGADVRSGGAAPDLRASQLALDPQVFRQIVKDGVLLQQGMPRFDRLDTADLDAIYTHIRRSARASNLQGKP